jgi:hypothetical protein
MVQLKHIFFGKKLKKLKKEKKRSSANTRILKEDERHLLSLKK